MHNHKPNPRRKGPTVVERRLEARIARFNKLPTKEQRKSTRPGSRNFRK